MSEENGPLDSRAIGDAEIIHKEEVWKTVEGWCPLCWWRSGKEQFAIATPAAGLRKRLTEKHRLEKPNCHEKIRVEGK